MKQKHQGFTLLEIIFVIVILGIIAKFGVEFLAQAYRGFIYQSVASNLQNSAEMATETVAAKLQYRLKDSVIIRDNNGNFKALEGANENDSRGYDILEWVGYDIDGFLGNTSATPLWSGIIDKEYAHQNPPPADIYTPRTDTSKIDALIQSLGGEGIDDAAIFIMSSDSDVHYDYGWQYETTTGSIQDQNHAIHPITSDANLSKFASPFAQKFQTLNQNLKDARYKLVWSAYALVYDNQTKELWFYYNYQPWKGEAYNDPTTKRALLMKNVSSFRKRQSFNVMKIQICVKSDLIKRSSQDQEQYSVCKEKTIY